MKTKTKLKELESEFDNHKKNYIPIPKPKLLPIIGTLIFGFLSYLNLYLIDWKLVKVVFSSREVIEAYNLKLTQLIDIYPIIGEYILISLTIICFVSIFKKLKAYNEDGLIIVLIFGLIAGLIMGLIFGLIAGLISGLIGGLIAVLIAGLIGGLIAGLIGGLIEEIN